jgi:hypothetical protein
MRGVIVNLTSFLKSQKTEEVVSRILQLIESMKKGIFTPSRERNELSITLGNPEHIGRTRGLGKQKT